MTLRADRGRSTTGGEQTQLHDDVLLTRAAQGKDPELRIQSDYVLLLSQEEIARTDRPVKITQGGSTLTGVGMEFNNSTRVLTVFSRVRGVWATSPER